MAYVRAPVSEDGVISLEGGKRYFIDTQVGDWNSVISEIAEVFDRKEFGEILLSGRGQIMASFYPSADVKVPHSVTSKVGYFYELPEGEILEQVSLALYGHGTLPKEGLLDWIAKEYPAVLDSAVRGGEAIGKAAIDHSKTIVNVVVIGVGAWVLVTLLKRIK